MAHTNRSAWTKASRKEESKEEKKARKAAAKVNQRVARQNKKTLRGVYAEESARVMGTGAKRELGGVREGVSVFKYSY